MRRLRVDAAARGLVDREPLRLRHLDAGLRQSRLDHAVPRLLPGILGLPHLADEEPRLVTEQDVKLKGRRRPLSAVLPHALVDLVVLLARQGRRCIPDENGHDANLTHAVGTRGVCRSAGGLHPFRTMPPSPCASSIASNSGETMLMLRQMTDMP